MTKKNAAAPESCEGCPCDSVDGNKNPDCPPYVWCSLQRAISKGEILSAIDLGESVSGAGKGEDCTPMSYLARVKSDLMRISGGR